MCTSWTDQQWKDKSQPAQADSEYTLVDTRYNQAGEAVHTYISNIGTWYGVLPGYGNHPMFSARRDDPRGDALAFLTKHGYALEEKPTTIADLIGYGPGVPEPASPPDLAEPLALGDLVQNFS